MDSMLKRDGLTDLPKPDIRIDAFGDILPTNGRKFVIGDFFTPEQMQDYARAYASQITLAQQGQALCHVRYRCSQRWDGNGNNDPQIYDGWEVCEAHERGDDGGPAIPVFAPDSSQLALLAGPDDLRQRKDPDPSHPQYVAGFKEGHKAGRARALPAGPVAWVNSSQLASSKISRERGGPFDLHTWSECKTDFHDSPLGVINSDPQFHEWDPDGRYAALEKEHLGDPEKGTGIYHPNNCKSPAVAQPVACHRCGLPMSGNPHPDAGKPNRLLEVNTQNVCIPCLTSNRHQWAQRAIKAEGDTKRLDMFEKNGRLSMELRHSDPEEPGVWTVLEENGGWNDREWSVAGTGATVRDAIDAARAALCQPAEEKKPHEWSTLRRGVFDVFSDDGAIYTTVFNSLEALSYLENGWYVEEQKPGQPAEEGGKA